MPAAASLWPPAFFWAAITGRSRSRAFLLSRLASSCAPARLLLLDFRQLENLQLLRQFIAAHFGGGGGPGFHRGFGGSGSGLGELRIGGGIGCERGFFAGALRPLAF